MKTIFLKSIAMVAMVMCTFCAKAQVSKGMKLINGNIGYSRNDTKNEDPQWILKGTSSSIYVSPGFGYFIGDRVCLGVALPFYSAVSKSENESVSTGATLFNSMNSDFQYGINPFARYYIPFSEKFYAYLQVGVQGSLIKRETKFNNVAQSEKEGFNISSGLNLGLTYFVSSRLACELKLVNIAYTYENVKRTDLNNNTIKNNSFGVNYLGSGLNLGVSYYLK